MVIKKHLLLWVVVTAVVGICDIPPAYCGLFGKRQMPSRLPSFSQEAESSLNLEQYPRRTFRVLPKLQASDGSNVKSEPTSSSIPEGKKTQAGRWFGRVGGRIAQPLMFFGGGALIALAGISCVILLDKAIPQARIHPVLVEPHPDAAESSTKRVVTIDDYFTKAELDPPPEWIKQRLASDMRNYRFRSTPLAYEIRDCLQKGKTTRINLDGKGGNEQKFHGHWIIPPSFGLGQNTVSISCKKDRCDAMLGFKDIVATMGKLHISSDRPEEAWGVLPNLSEAVSVMLSEVPTPYIVAARVSQEAKGDKVLTLSYLDPDSEERLETEWHQSR